MRECSSTLLAAIILTALTVGQALSATAAAQEKPMTQPQSLGPPAGGKWVAIPELTDEFDGDKLDTAKWHDHNPTWKGRQPALFMKSNVQVRDGQLHLTMRAEAVGDAPKGYHTFTSAAVQSKATVRYGYFEIRCKPMDSHGSSAFWFYHQTPEIWTEIDVFEIGGKAPKHERAYHMNAHVFHTLADGDRHWSRGGNWTAPYRLADGYHIYALEWDAKVLRYFVDGAIVREMANTHWHQPLTLNFDSETMPDWFGLPDPKDLPSTFRIDYVRSWRRAEGYGADRPVSCEFTFDPAEAAAGKGVTKSYRIPAEGGAALSVVAKHAGQPRPDRIRLECPDDAFFAAQKADRAERTITVKDRAGRAVSFTFSWEKAKGYDKNAGYRPDWLDIRPADAKPKPGDVFSHDLTPASGPAIRMKLAY